MSNLSLLYEQTQKLEINGLELELHHIKMSTISYILGDYLASKELEIEKWLNMLCVDALQHDMEKIKKIAMQYKIKIAMEAYRLSFGDLDVKKLIVQAKAAMIGMI